MYYYRLYGMLLESELCFPEADELTPPVTPDATLTLGMPPEWVVTEYRQGKFSSITEQVMWFRLYDELLVYVEQGSKAIVWKLDPALDEVRMRTYLLSGAITFLLLQRGYLLIHGSALCCKDKAYLISGPSGSGKSTTALHLMKQPGILFASDDIRDLPGSGYARMSCDAIRTVNIPISGKPMRNTGENLQTPTTGNRFPWEACLQSTGITARNCPVRSYPAAKSCRS